MLNLFGCTLYPHRKCCASISDITGEQKGKSFRSAAPAPANDISRDDAKP
eukprot:COSAG01_NODE_1546_length_9957_cov_20.812741_2_plen_50_part_00